MHLLFCAPCHFARHGPEIRKVSCDVEEGNNFVTSWGVGGGGGKGDGSGVGV